MMTALLLLGLALQQTAAALPTPIILDEIRTFATATDNDQRFETLTKLLASYELSFVVEPFTLDAPRGSEPRTTGRNVIVTLGQGSEEVVVGAHYDAVRLKDGTLSGGVVDNASAVVMLVHVAKTLKSERLTRRVRFVWFDMEETDLLGSKRYLQMHPPDAVVAMLNFDVNAYGDTMIFGAPAGADAEALRAPVGHACADTAIDCLRFTAMPSGDDLSFGAAGVPTLSFGTVTIAEAHQLWLLQHGGPALGLAPGTIPAILLAIHSHFDQPDRVNAATVLRVRDFALNVVRRLATAP
jgi:hypothetical protein